MGAVREEERDHLGRKSGGNMGGHRVGATWEDTVWKQLGRSSGYSCGGEVIAVREEEWRQLGRSGCS